MLSTMYQASTIPVLEQVLKFTEARHSVLAGNIANVDTPGYKTRDLSPALFQERLREAIQSRQQPTSPRYDGYSTYDTSRTAETTRDVFQKVEDSMNSILRHDDGDVHRQIQRRVRRQPQDSAPRSERQHDTTQ